PFVLCLAGGGSCRRRSGRRGPLPAEARGTICRADLGTDGRRCARTGGKRERAAGDRRRFDLGRLLAGFFAGEGGLFGVGVDRRRRAPLASKDEIASRQYF